MSLRFDLTRHALMVFMLLCSAPFAAEGQDPLGLQGEAADKVRNDGLAKARSEDLKAAMDAAAQGNSRDSCFAAELMRLVGDYRASRYYEEAISRDHGDPGCEFLYSQYLRVYRGAGEPLFPKAEEHLLAAERKYRCLSDSAKKAFRSDFAGILARAFADLYQRDGLGIAVPSPHSSSTAERGNRFGLFESLGARGGRSDSDFDREALIRDLTSGLVLAQTRSPLSSPGYLVPLAFLQANVRYVMPAAATERVRFRDGQMPVVDLFVSGQDSENAQITHYGLGSGSPGAVPYNPVKLSQFGFAVEHPFSLGPIDAALGFTYHRERRWGVIEDLPRGREDIDQADVFAAASRFIGPDKLDVQFTFTNQDISPTAGLSRTRRLYGGTLGWEIYRFGSAYARKFQNTRGIILNAGILHDLENYPAPGTNTAVTRRDYFGSATVRAFHRFDLNLQPTWFTSRVSNDPKQSNSQYETAGYVLYRIVDEERTPGLPKAVHGMRLAFLNLGFPFHYDVAMKGPAAFENYKAGTELSAKWFTTARRGVTFLGSVRYDYQNFYNIDRSFHLVTGALTMGF